MVGREAYLTTPAGESLFPATRPTFTAIGCSRNETLRGSNESIESETAPFAIPNFRELETCTWLPPAPPRVPHITPVLDHAHHRVESHSPQRHRPSPQCGFVQPESLLPPRSGPKPQVSRKNRVRLSLLLLGPRFYYPLCTVLITAKVLHRFAGAWPFAFSKHNRAILFSASTSARFSSLPLESTPDSSLIPQLHLVWGCRLFRARLCPPERLWRDLPFSLSSTTPCQPNSLVTTRHSAVTIRSTREI
jgi:hypothetical protein